MSGIYWLASYPKSGNTWLRSFLFNLQQNGAAPADINDLSTGHIASARNWLDEVLGFDTAELDSGEVERLRPAVYRWTLNNSHISYHKIHDACTLTPDGEHLVNSEATRGALYIVRNPLDVAVSAASHWHLSLDETIDCMRQPDMTLARNQKGLYDQVPQKLLSWSQHVLSWVNATHLNLQVIRYEDMLANPIATFTQAAQFLQLPTEPSRIEKAVRFSDFKILSQQEAEKGFKERPMRAERFFRQGKSGDWLHKLTSSQVHRILTDHGEVMQRFGYMDDTGNPI